MGQTRGSPLIEQAGNGFTVRITSSVFKHPTTSVTDSRSVAVAVVPVTITVGDKELGELMLAGPEMTPQFVEVRGVLPDCTNPFIEKDVVAPSVHLVWSGPASEIGPSRKLT